MSHPDTTHSGKPEAAPVSSLSVSLSAFHHGPVAV